MAPRDHDSGNAYDTLVIGGGPAGLTAATYLARFRRRVALLSAGRSRAEWIPTSHNVPGFPDGIEGVRMLERLRQQALEYGAEIHNGRVNSLEHDAGWFAARVGETLYRSPFVILATGVQDEFPDVPGVPAALSRGILRVCPICDGYEAIDREVAVMGTGPHAEREAAFLRTYSELVTYVALGEVNRAVELRCHEAGIALLPAQSRDIQFVGDGVTVALPTAEIRFDVAYSALGCRPLTRLAATLGAAADDNGSLVVSAHQETSVPGLYAAGDIVRGLNQIIVAEAEGAIAATHIHNRLRAGVQ